MAEPTYELYDGDPDAGGTKVGELRYDLTNNQAIVRDEKSGEEIRLDAAGLDASTVAIALADLSSADHASLTNILSDQHHAKYTDEEAQDAAGTIFDSTLAYDDAIPAMGVANSGITPTQLDLSMAPTWTGPHTWSGEIQSFQRSEPASGGVIVKRIIDSTSGDELRWKLTSSGILKLVVWDASSSTERDLWQVDPANGTWDQLATLNFPNITGTPTFASHDHSEGGLAAVQSVGQDVITTAEILLSISPTWTSEHTWGAAHVMAHISTPTSPASGHHKIYVKSDGNVYKLAPDGTESQVGGGGTDTRANISEDGTQIVVDVTDMDFVGAISVTNDGDGSVTVEGLPQVAYEPGMVAWASGLSNAEIWRIVLQTGEVFHLERVEFRQKGGGSSASASVDVYDATAAAAIDSVNLGSTSATGGTSGTGNVVLARVTNSTDGSINAAPSVRGWIE